MTADRGRYPLLDPVCHRQTSDSFRYPQSEQRWCEEREHELNPNTFARLGDIQHVDAQNRM